jgi:hypothetical protein
MSADLARLASRAATITTSLDVRAELTNAAVEHTTALGDLATRAAEFVPSIEPLVTMLVASYAWTSALEIQQLGRR